MNETIKVNDNPLSVMHVLLTNRETLLCWPKVIDLLDRSSGQTYLCLNVVGLGPRQGSSAHIAACSPSLCLMWALFPLRQYSGLQVNMLIPESQQKYQAISVCLNYKPQVSMTDMQWSAATLTNRGKILSVREPQTRSDV